MKVIRLEETLFSPYKMSISYYILLIFSVYAKANRRYDDFKLLQVVPTNNIQLSAMQLIREKGDQIFPTIDFWREPSTINRPTDIMIGPNDLRSLTDYLSYHQMPAKVLANDVQKLFDKEISHDKKLFKLGDSQNEFAIDQYHSIQEISDWMETLAAKYPDRINILSIGSSFEKRDMKVIKIGSKGTNKPGYFLDAGVHAREWIAVSTAVYIINELATKYDSNLTYKELVDKIDFYILPSLNPDGYEYTQKDRMWRKTRSGPYGKASCIGVDANRNWDFHWMESGSSSSPCSDSYAGPKAFSEIEAQNLASFLQLNNATLKSYVTLHSYSDLFMYPYAYKAKTYPPDVDELKAIATEGAEALKSIHGTTYQIGSVPDVLYEASGSTMDWAKAIAGIKYCFALELRPGPGDPDPDQRYGFALPPEYIIRVGEETWAGLQVIAKKLISP